MTITSTPPPMNTAAEVAAAARELFPDGPLLARKILHWRPYIVPLQTLLQLVPAGARVLDIGCGEGLLLGLLARAGRLTSGVGIDSGAAKIQTAKAMASREGFALEFIEQQAQEFSAQEQFDAVCMIDLMHHLPPAAQRETFTAACARVAPGGMLIYKDMCRRPHWRALANRAHDLLRAGDWINYAPIADVENWVRECGLTLHHRADIKQLWYGHELRVFRF